MPKLPPTRDPRVNNIKMKIKSWPYILAIWGFVGLVAFLGLCLVVGFLA